MKKAEFHKLLAQAQDTWLDWQESFPLELLKGEDHPEWETGQAKLLRDLAALANRSAGRQGFLVFGVADHGARREVKGIFKSWQGTDFQSWAHQVFDPPLRFSYSELPLDENIRVGIFTVDRSPQYPHVATRSLGGILHPGQVWVRRGPENSIALYEDLREMFAPGERAGD
jgi:hypothetical protein